MWSRNKLMENSAYQHHSLSRIRYSHIPHSTFCPHHLRWSSYGPSHPAFSQQSIQYMHVYVNKIKYLFTRKQSGRILWYISNVPGQDMGLRGNSCSSVLCENMSMGDLVQSTPVPLNLEDPLWSRYTTITVISSWKWRLTPFSIFFMSLYLISLLFAASATAALTSRFAIPCKIHEICLLSTI